MALEWVRKYCLSLPHTTEHVQWGSDLVFKIEGKMFALIVLEPHPVCMSFKASPEKFADLVEQPGLIPAPYLARAHWVALETPDALPQGEVLRLLKQAHGLVFGKLPTRVQDALLTVSKTETKPKKKTASKRRANKKPPF
jgi:predicted DNA-binding protein (MmcQ/YjbR family)